jgi:hypothetical protein
MHSATRSHGRNRRPAAISEIIIRQRFRCPYLHRFIPGLNNLPIACMARVNRRSTKKVKIFGRNGWVIFASKYEAMKCIANQGVSRGEMLFCPKARFMAW